MVRHTDRLCDQNRARAMPFLPDAWAYDIPLLPAFQNILPKQLSPLRERLPFLTFVDQLLIVAHCWGILASWSRTLLPPRNTEDSSRYHKPCRRSAFTKAVERRTKMKRKSVSIILARQYFTRAKKVRIARRDRFMCAADPKLTKRPRLEMLQTARSYIR